MSWTVPRPTSRQVWTALHVLLSLVLAVTGALMIGDRAGLEAEYFSLGAPWEGKAVHSRVSEPRLQRAADILEDLTNDVAFSVRWRGWWSVAESGRHAFALNADDGGYLRVDGELLADTRGLFGEQRDAGRKLLEAGFHRIEVGLYQTLGKSRLAVGWAAPEATAASELPVGDLYSGRPLALRQALRRGFAEWPRTYRQLLGAALLLAAALLLLARVTPGQSARLSAAFRALFDRRDLRTALLLGLFAFTFFASLPFTGTVRGGDDTAYLTVAQFGEKQWFFNRYAHVYLLKLFIFITGGDPLVGVRVWWSFVFATTVSAIAVAVASLGRGLQLKTLAVTLFVLLSQTTILGLIGAGFADYTAMMFVTVTVAVYLHGLARRRDDRGPPNHDWHALAIGALSLAAFRSKEVGAVLFLLPALFLLDGGHFDLRRFARRFLYWSAGAFTMLAILVLLDGWILGEFFFTFNSNRLARSRGMNFPGAVEPRGDTESWLHAIWFTGKYTAGLSLRNLWLAVGAAAVAAGLSRQRLEIRLLHFLPVAYLLALIVLYIRMPHPIGGRMLIPILPVACLMTGFMAHYAGLDEIEWRWLLSPGVLIPTALACSAICLVAVPYRLGELESAAFLPAEMLTRFGWKPDLFVVGVLFPALVLVGLGIVAFVVPHRRGRAVILALAYLAFFGVGFEFNRATLAKRWAVQKGDLLVHPFMAFREELEATKPRRIVLSTDLRTRYGMSGVTTGRLASVVLRRGNLDVALSRSLPADADVAIASQYTYRTWLRQEPTLAETAVFEPSGFLVLVRPGETAGKSDE